MKCKSIFIPNRINFLYREYKTSILYTYCSTQYSTLALGRLVLPVWPSTLIWLWVFVVWSWILSLNKFYILLINIQCDLSFCISIWNLLRLNHASPPPPKKTRYFKVSPFVFFHMKFADQKVLFPPTPVVVSRALDIREF